MSIGLLLRKKRNKHGYSQQYVANFLNISRNSYIEWERDKTDITIKKLQLICELYEVNLAELLNGYRVR